MGARPEALLGDHNAEDLGIISFNPEGGPTEEGQEGKSFEDVNNTSNTAMLRKTDKEVITERPPQHRVKAKSKEETTRIVSGYKRPVLTETKTKKGPVRQGQRPGHTWAKRIWCESPSLQLRF